MLKYIARRLALAVPTLIAVSLITFLIGHYAPGDPITAKLGEKGTPLMVKQLRSHYGLDRPVTVQYWSYVSGAVRGDFGISYRNDRPVSYMMAQAFPVTARLAVVAMVLALLVGIPLGVTAALKQNSWIDRLAMATALGGVSIPSFVIAPILMIIVVITGIRLPIAGWGYPENYILPVLVLSIRPIALFARHTRSAMLEVIRQDYIRTAYAKGLSSFNVIFRHGLRNAILPVLTVSGTVFGYLLSGSFIVEYVFAIPGIGFQSIDAISRRDYTVIQATTLLVAVGFVLVNLMVDLLYAWADPRIRHAHS